jgi:hypothetical protein
MSEKALEEINSRMENNALLLTYLSTNKVQIEPLGEHLANLPAAIPVRMHFGKINTGRNVWCKVWILLYVGRMSSRAPEVRFRIFDRQDKAGRAIPMHEAIDNTKYAVAFKSLKGYADIDSTKLRAVINYFFIAKNVDVSYPWQFAHDFITDLTAACRIAKVNIDRTWHSGKTMDNMGKESDNAALSKQVFGQPTEEVLHQQATLSNDESSMGTPDDQRHALQNEDSAAMNLSKHSDEIYNSLPIDRTNQDFHFYEGINSIAENSEGSSKPTLTQSDSTTLVSSEPIVSLKSSSKFNN